MARFSRVLLLLAILVAIMGVVFYYFVNRPAVTAPPPPLASVIPPAFSAALQGKDTQAPTRHVATQNPSADGTVKAQFSGNGRDLITGKVSNLGTTDAVFSVPVGQIFEGGPSALLSLREATVEVPAGGEANLSILTVPLKLRNDTLDSPYKVSGRPPGALKPLVEYVSANPGTPYPILQTAALLLAENPEAAEIKRRPASVSDLPSDSNDVFRVSVPEIMQALLLARKATGDVSGLKVSTDPSLKTEALVGLASAELAREFYAVTPQNSWAYLKNLLTQGDPRYRHYALFGIGRQFPEVALQMMPRWIGNPNLPLHYRVAAVHGLAQTNNPEALPLLESMAATGPWDVEVKQALDRGVVYLRAKLGVHPR